MTNLLDFFVDIIEGFFIESDLVDLNMSESELCERASFDSLAVDAVSKSSDDETPIGKRVI